jgi:FG-GAP-like repeat
MQPLWSNAANSCVMGTVASTLPTTPDDQRLKGDFTGDGKSDVAVVYDFANLQTRFYVLTSTGSAFSAPAVWYDSGAGTWDWTRSKAVVADFNGDGKSDIGVL